MECQQGLVHVAHLQLDRRGPPCTDPTPVETHFSRRAWEGFASSVPSTCSASLGLVGAVGWLAVGRFLFVFWAKN